MVFLLLYFESSFPFLLVSSSSTFSITFNHCREFFKTQITEYVCKVCDCVWEVSLFSDCWFVKAWKGRTGCSNFISLPDWRQGKQLEGRQEYKAWGTKSAGTGPSHQGASAPVKRGTKTFTFIFGNYWEFVKLLGPCRILGASASMLNCPGPFWNGTDLLGLHWTHWGHFGICATFVEIAVLFWSFWYFADL